MAKLRLRVLALTTWLVLFFNIERLDIDGSDIVNLPPYTYLLGIAAAILPLLLRGRKVPVLLIATPLMLLFVGGVLVDRERAFNGGGIYVTFTSLFLLASTLLVSRTVAEALEEFAQAVEAVTLLDSQGVLLDMDEAKPQIENEMLRSRRTQRPLSLVVVQAKVDELKTAPQQLILDVQRTMAVRYLLSVTARMLSKSLRRTDLMIETGQPGRMVLIAPETAPDAAALLGERVERQIHDRLGIATRYAVVSFPDGGLTFESLLAAAEESLATAPTHPAGHPVPSSLAEVLPPSMPAIASEEEHRGQHV